MSGDGSPPQWAADPSGRFEWRYWDGSKWTPRVARDGRQTVDVVESSWAALSELSMGSGQSGTPTSELSASADAGALILPAPPLAPAPTSSAGSMPPPLPGTEVSALGAGAWWRPLDGLKTTLIVLLICAGVAALSVAGTLANRVQVIDDFDQASRVTATLAQRARSADDAVSTASAALLLLVIATGVVFIIWQWRAAKDAAVLGRAWPRFGPGWSIGGWFIPLANLVIPVLIVQDLWRATSPFSEPGSHWRQQPRSALVSCWWTLLIAGWLLSRAPGASGESLSDLRSRDQIALVGFVLAAGAAALATVMVVKLTRRFNEAALRR
jgi:hypothetical protein